MDKARYIKEMASYKPPLSEDEEEPGHHTDSKPKKKRRKKNPSAPKGRKSGWSCTHDPAPPHRPILTCIDADYLCPIAYIFFCNDVRARLIEDNKELKLTQLSKLMGQEWKKLDDEGKQVG